VPERRLHAARRVAPKRRSRDTARYAVVGETAGHDPNAPESGSRSLLSIRGCTWAQPGCGRHGLGSGKACRSPAFPDGDLGGYSQCIPEAPNLSSRQLGEFALAALRNAVLLVQEAEILSERERWPRAYALAILAGEEVGKCMSCVGAATSGPHDEKFWRKFHRSLNDHKAKYGITLANVVAAMSDQQQANVVRGRFATILGEDYDLKLASLYVDFSGDQPSDPVRDVHSEVAREAIRVIGEITRAWADYWDDELPDILAAGIRHKHPDIGAAMATANHAELVELVYSARWSKFDPGEDLH
jgi:AbiV family abortive infection protein